MSTDVQQLRIDDTPVPVQSLLDELRMFGSDYLEVDNQIKQLTAEKEELRAKIRTLVQQVPNQKLSIPGMVTAYVSETSEDYEWNKDELNLLAEALTDAVARDTKLGVLDMLSMLLECKKKVKRGGAFTIKGLKPKTK